MAIKTPDPIWADEEIFRQSQEMADRMAPYMGHFVCGICKEPYVYDKADGICMDCHHDTREGARARVELYRQAQARQEDEALRACLSPTEWDRRQAWLAAYRRGEDTTALVASWAEQDQDKEG